MESEIRRQRSTLAISGIAYIAFDFWFIVKAAMLLFISPDRLKMEVGELFQGLPDQEVYYRAAIIVLFGFLAVGFVMRLYVGLSALSESRGGRRGILYLVVAAVVAAAGTFATIRYVTHLTSPRELFGGYVPGIVDLVSLVALVDLVIAAIRLKLLTRRAHGQG